MNSAKTILKIDLAAIAGNYKLLQSNCENSKVGATVKANAYGLGAAQIAKVLHAGGCEDFFVVSVAEGLELRSLLGNGVNIYILYGPFTEDCDFLQEHNLIPVINHLGQLELWQKLARRLQKELPFVLHIDTGINRLGMPVNEVKRLIDKADLFSNLKMLYLMSHLTASEEKDSPSNSQQLLLFNQLAAYFPGIKKCFVNSSGIFLGSDYHFDLARPGAAIYGLNPTPYAANPMKNVIALVSPIIQIKTIESGEMVGYNGTFTADRNHTIATLPIGYADGYLRALSNTGIVYINNRPAPVVGRISMDLITVDISDLSPADIFLGQEVEIIGKNSPADKIAKLCNTNGYEILTSLGKRFERVYTKV